MFLWFLVLAPVIVAEVFRSPMADYRAVALGALIPLVELAVGGPGVLHTLLAPILAMALVMAVTTGRRLLRRQLLGIPIGLFLHLVLDGTWASKELFWWPLFGRPFPDQPPPAFDVPALGVFLEVLAIGVAVWAYRRYELSDPGNRQLLLQRGQLSRVVLS